VIDTIPAADHPLLRAAAFVTDFPRPLAALPTPPWLANLLRADAPAPFRPDEAVRTAVRDALRVHGYKPTGRGKPASEYLARAAEQGTLGSINLAVDACNATSLHSGFPITVVHLDRARPPFRIDVAGGDQGYVFNPSGQEIRLGGLPCLFDADGPCGNAVKDAQRTKTDGATRRTLSVVWGCAPHEERAARATAWYRELLERTGAPTTAVEVEAGGRQQPDTENPEVPEESEDT
jgi:DNA/RNA-binding domain of Phe-tRNA-synthetase-like protein